MLTTLQEEVLQVWFQVFLFKKNAQLALVNYYTYRMDLSQKNILTCQTQV